MDQNHGRRLARFARNVINETVTLIRNRRHYINRLPNEILELILARDLLDNRELIQARLVNRRWNIVARVALFQITLFIHPGITDEYQYCARRYNDGTAARYRTIAYSGNSPNSRRIPFSDARVQALLFSTFENIRVVTITNVNPHRFLVAVRNHARVLEAIEVDWSSIGRRDTAAVFGAFYGANLAHRNTIRVITVPRSERGLRFIAYNDGFHNRNVPLPSLSI